MRATTAAEVKKGDRIVRTVAGRETAVTVTHVKRYRRLRGWWAIQASPSGAIDLTTREYVVPGNEVIFFAEDDVENAGYVKSGGYVEDADGFVDNSHGNDDTKKQ